MCYHLVQVDVVKKVSILFQFFLMFVIPSFVFSVGFFEAGLYQNNAGKLLYYRIHLPDKILEMPTDSPEFAYPLLLYFHGSGQRGRDNFLQLAGSPQDILKITKKTESVCNYGSSQMSTGISMG